MNNNNSSFWSPHWQAVPQGGHGPRASGPGAILAETMANDNQRLEQLRVLDYIYVYLQMAPRHSGVFAQALYSALRDSSIQWDDLDWTRSDSDSESANSESAVTGTATAGATNSDGFGPVTAFPSGSGSGTNPGKNLNKSVTNTV